MKAQAKFWENDALPRIMLVSTVFPRIDDTHWASPYYSLRRAFQESPTYARYLVDQADDADVIIVCPRLANPVFPREFCSIPHFFRNYRKTIVFSTDDQPLVTHPGVYTAFLGTALSPACFFGGFYPHVMFKAELDQCLAKTPEILFSFRGDTSTHAVRTQMMFLSQTLWNLNRDLAGKFEYVNVRSPAIDPSSNPSTYGERYLESIANAKFILCPRGKCPSSIRLFEAMRAQRVPVIISDSWRAPSFLLWKEFAIQIKERDVAQLPAILAQEESSFSERSLLSRSAWEDNFSTAALPKTILELAAGIQRNRSGANVRSSLPLFKQLVTWRFLRRGLISEIAKIIR